MHISFIIYARLFVLTEVSGIAVRLDKTRQKLIESLDAGGDLDPKPHRTCSLENCSSFKSTTAKLDLDGQIGLKTGKSDFPASVFQKEAKGGSGYASKNMRHL